MWLLLCLLHESQPLDLTAVLGSGRHDIDPGSVDAAMAQNICQLRDVLFYIIKGTGEQLAQIVGKDLSGVDVGNNAEFLHPRPDIAPVKGIAAPGNEYRPGGNLPFSREIQQKCLQLARD